MLSSGYDIASEILKSQKLSALDLPKTDPVNNQCLQTGKTLPEGIILHPCWSVDYRRIPGDRESLC